MYTFREQIGEYDSLNCRCKELVKRILQRVKPLRLNQKIMAQQVLFKDPQEKGKLYLLKDGPLNYTREGTVLFYFEEGDLVGLETHFQTARSEIKSDFAVNVDEYSYSDLKSAISTDSKLQELWDEYFTAQRGLLELIIGNLLKGEKDFTPMIRVFQTGERIIKQGDESKEVYTLFDGKAEVFVDGVKVGEVLPNEIFGALGALTDKARLADVVASANSMVLCLPKDSFIDLVQSRPHTVLNLVQDMARMIASLNEKVVNLHKL